MTADRYESLTRHADAGLGTDEPEIHRFTRPTDRVSVEQKTPPTDSAKNQVEGSTNTHLTTGN